MDESAHTTTSELIVPEHPSSLSELVDPETTPTRTVASIAAGPDAEPRHAMARPMPTPPEPAPSTVTPWRPEPSPVLPTPRSAVDLDTVGPDELDDVIDNPSDDETAAYEFPEPHLPTAHGWAVHLLGSLTGLVVAPLGGAGLLLGQARLGWAEASGSPTDIVGVALVMAMAVLLAGLALLGSWTAAAPMAGGTVATGVGGLALVAPGYTSDLLARAVDAPTWSAIVQAMASAAASGVLLAVGLLLVAVATSTIITRRSGIRLGASHARHGLSPAA